MIEFGGREIRPELLWDAHLASAPEWLKPYLKVPRDAAPPLMMTPVHPEAVGSYGPDAIKWVETEIGIRLRWWQQLVIVRQLEHRSDGSLCWRDVVETASRRVGKSVRLRCMALWRLENGAALFGEPQLAIHTGKDLGIVREIIRGAWTWAERRGWRVNKAIGREVIERIAPYEQTGDDRWLARAMDSVYGYDTTLGMVDEGWAVDPMVVSEGMDPAVMERFSAQVVLTSTAHRRATSLMRGRISDAMATDTALLVLWGAPDGCDPSSRKVWKAASAHWSQARLDLMQAKYDKAARGESDPELDDPDPMAGFMSQYLNCWQLRKGAGGALPGWSDLVTERVPPAAEALGVASDPSGAWYSLGVYGDGFVAPLVRQRSELGREPFVKMVVEAAKARGLRVAVGEKGMAGPLIPHLRAAGVTVSPTSFDDLVQGSADFADAVDTSTVAHGAEAVLDAAVLASRWRKTGDRRSINTRGPDVSMLEAVILARHIATSTNTEAWEFYS